MRAWPVVLMMMLPLGGVAQEEGVVVDVELVMAVDVSGSVDALEAEQQRQGYIDAIRDPEVLDAITGNYRGRIAIAYVEWAGDWYQTTVVDWQVIEDKASAEQFAARLDAAPRGRQRYTSISAAIDYAAAMFDGNGYVGDRMVIDVSGDGPNNRGRPVTMARDDALAKGIVINGLPIMNDRAQPWVLPTPMEFGLDGYYERNVIGGPASFIVSATDFDDITEAVRRKLVLEIAGLRPPPTASLASADR